MGISLFGSSSSSRAERQCRAPCDPIPTSFTIKHVWEKPPRGRYKALCKIGKTWRRKDKVLAEIVYPNCSTFEGRKLILFAGVTVDWLGEQTSIDPHFTEDGHIIARFAPTADGLALALKCLSS